MFHAFAKLPAAPGTCRIHLPPSSASLKDPDFCFIKLGTGAYDMVYLSMSFLHLRVSGVGWTVSNRVATQLGVCCEGTWAYCKGKLKGTHFFLFFFLGGAPHLKSKINW